MRDRLVAILAATAVALTGVAHTCVSYDYDRGIIGVGRTGSGTLGAYSRGSYGEPGNLYESADGGITWIETSHYVYPFGEYEFDVQDWTKLEAMDTSGAVYIIDGVNIVREWSQGEELEPPSEVTMTSENRYTALGPSASRHVVYSFEYLQRHGNRWMQALDTGAGASEVTTRPYGLFYDDQSGNLFVAMGRQGIVIVAPDGTSTRVAVDHWLSPTDFSLRGKIEALFDPLLLRWTLQYPGIALLLALSFAALASVGPTAPTAPRSVLVVAAAFAALLSIFMGVYPQSPWYEGGDFEDLVGLIVFYLSGNGWIPAIVTALLTAGGLIFARPTLRQVLLFAAISTVMLLLIGLGALVLFVVGAMPANFAAVGIVGLATIRIWMWVTHQCRSIASCHGSEP